MESKLLALVRCCCTRRAAGKAAMSLLLTMVAWQWSQAAIIHGKAVLAQHLVETAWQQILESPEQSIQDFKPWPSADTWPVARLQWVGSHRADSILADLYVLAGADGSSLAFGPGLMAGTALPGEGPSAIAAHRDTHFRFLEDLAVDDLLRIQNRQGDWLYYRTTQMRIVNADEEQLQLGNNDRLYLVTCYPFNAIQAGGPLRYLVEAEQFSF